MPPVQKFPDNPAKVIVCVSVAFADNHMDVVDRLLILFVSEARIFGKHALGNQGKSYEHSGNSLLDMFRRVYIF